MKGAGVAGTVLMIAALTAGLLAGCAEEKTVVDPPPDGSPYRLSDFTSADDCAPCHPQYYDEWKGSMHRYSTSDPIWMLANNALQSGTSGRLGRTCFQCHAPVGFLTGKTKDSFQFSDLDPLVREGITCDFCHVLRPPYVSTDQHVRYTLEPGRVKYGALSDPVPTGAHEHGYDAEYDRSTVCRQCHDLTVNGVPLEVTFAEWQGSPWGAMSVECQDCHMTTYTGRAATGGPVRSDLHRHTFAGADVAITDFPFKAEQKSEIEELMRNAASLELVAPPAVPAGDTASVTVRVINDKTGHNLPTSVFFNRQMWIEVTIWKGTDTVYRSGHLDANGDLMDANSALRPNEDRDLVNFNGELYKDGRPSNVFELDSLVNRSIPPFGVREAAYRRALPEAGTWSVKARLLFRPFGPYLFRSLGAEAYVTELPIFEMVSRETTIAAN